MHYLLLAYQRKWFDGIYTLFTECFQSKVRGTKHKAIITNVAKIFSREITLSELSAYCISFISLDTSCILVTIYLTSPVSFYISMFLTMGEIYFMKYIMSITEVVFIFLIRV